MYKSWPDVPAQSLRSDAVADFANFSFFYVFLLVVPFLVFVVLNRFRPLGRTPVVIACHFSPD